MATRFGSSRFPDHLVGTEEDDQLHGYEMAAGPWSDTGGDTLEGRGGDDYLAGGWGNDTLRGGEDDDTLEGGVGGDVLDGGNGIDTATYANSRGAVYLSLLLAMGYTGEAEGDTFISVENVIGSDHDDVITGNDVRNVIAGGDGHDRIYGEGGDDELNGGDGVDRLYGGAGRDWLLGGDDTDYLRGEDDSDWLNGGNGDDFLYGGRGDDVFYGSQGADLFAGGEGIGDYANYQGGTVRVIVNLQTGTGSGGMAEGDRYDGIENVRGTRYNDVIFGNEADNTLYGGDGGDGLYGGAGDDVVWGEGGADKLEGGSHLNGDTLNYQASDAGVYINLMTATARGGHAEGDTFAGFEHVRGSTYDDFLYGDKGSNHLDGNWGDDRIRGYEGGDILTGGNGGDTFVFGNVGESRPTLLGGPLLHDRIMDLTSDDVIDLRGIDANTTAAAPDDQAFVLIDGPGFTAAGQLRVETDAYSGDWIFLGETNGDGVADFMLAVRRHSVHLEFDDIHFLL